MGKLKALKEASWKVKDMAIEFGVSKQAIYSQLENCGKHTSERKGGAT